MKGVKNGITQGLRASLFACFAALCLPVVSLAQSLEGRVPFSPSDTKLALKTNLLADIAWLPNIGFELPLGEKWSIQGTYYHIWYDYDPSHYYWRMYGGDIEGRYWLKEAMLGHHIGLYGQLFTYDFELGGRGMQGKRPQFGIGVSYGWSFPVHKDFTLDFSVGLGYATGLYEDYIPCDDCYLWQNTKRLNYFGPTKAAISLVYHIR